MTLLAQQGLLQHREIVGILTRHLPDSVFVAAGTTKEAFKANPQAFNGTFPNDPFDPAEATQEIWDRIVERERAMQEIFDQYRYVTRLFTLISPDEMTIDPTFVFDPKLPDVDRVHRATAVFDCGVGGRAENANVRLEIEETGQTVQLGKNGQGDRSVLDSMPSAVKIEQLNEGRLIQDNSKLIGQLLDKHNSKVGGCGCSTTGASGGGSGALGLLALLLIGWVRRR